MAHKLGKNGLPVNSGLYWKRKTIYVQIKGKGYSTGKKDIDGALEFKRKKIVELDAESQSPAIDKEYTINDALDEYIADLKQREEEGGEYTKTTLNERPSYKAETRINAQLRQFGKLKVDGKPGSLSSDMLKAHRRRRIKEGRSPVTVNNEFRLLRAALNKAADATPPKINKAFIPNFSDKDIINHKADRKAKRIGTVTQDQFDAIMKHSPESLKVIFVTVMYTGVRQKEIKFVRRSEVDFENKVINLKAGETKDGDLRVVPINDFVLPMLTKWEAQTAEKYPACKWFFHHNGNRMGNFKNSWNNTLKKAGLRVPVLDEDGQQVVRERFMKMKDGTFTMRSFNVWKNLVRFHDTRRTNVTAMDEDEVQEKDMMRVSGHKTVGQNRDYNKSKRAAERVRLAQNKRLVEQGVLLSVETPVNDPEPSKAQETALRKDWKAGVQDLWAMHEKGMLTAEEFATEKEKVMANRSELP